MLTRERDSSRCLHTKENRGLCEVTHRGGWHQLDCVVVLQPDNLNSYKLSQLSGLQLGTTSRETEAMQDKGQLGKVLNPRVQE